MALTNQVKENGDRYHKSTKIRPGVPFPDWSVVSSELAKLALRDILQAFGVEKCFVDYDLTEDRLRISILKLIAQYGQAPSTDDLAQQIGIPKPAVHALLKKLRSKDLVVLNEGQDKIIGAYPLTERKTEHLIAIGGQQIHAMCAIDALGTGSMYQTDVTISSSCRASGSPIEIQTGSLGTKITSAIPKSAIVWSGIRISDGTAADSLCTVLAFFESETTFETWRNKEHSEIPGYLLSLEEAMQVGRAIFDPFLRMPNSHPANS